MSNEQSLEKVVKGIDLSLEEMSATINSIMQGSWGEQDIGLLLSGLARKGETVD